MSKSGLPAFHQARPEPRIATGIHAARRSTFVHRDNGISYDAIFLKLGTILANCSATPALG